MTKRETDTFEIDVEWYSHPDGMLQLRRHH